MVPPHERFYAPNATGRQIDNRLELQNELLALDRVALGAVARAASAALFRRITPVGTSFDGDVIFATAPTASEVSTPAAQVEALAVEALETAIERAVRTRRPGDVLA